MTDERHGGEPLRKRQWEAFAAAATGYDGGDPKTATEAYLAAYPSTRSRDAARANAARLAARPDVKARCAWMRKELAEKGVMDAHAIRAKVLKLRLDVIEKTACTKHKALALAAARDLDRLGYTAVDGKGPGGIPAGDGAAALIGPVTVNLRKFLESGEGEGGGGE